MTRRNWRGSVQRKGHGQQQEYGQGSGGKRACGKPCVKRRLANCTAAWWWSSSPAATCGSATAACLCRLAALTMGWTTAAPHAEAALPPDEPAAGAGAQQRCSSAQCLLPATGAAAASALPQARWQRHHGAGCGSARAAAAAGQRCVVGGAAAAAQACRRGRRSGGTPQPPACPQSGRRKLGVAGREGLKAQFRCLQLGTLRCAADDARVACNQQHMRRRVARRELETSLDSQVPAHDDHSLRAPDRLQIGCRSLIMLGASPARQVGVADLLSASGPAETWPAAVQNPQQCGAHSKVASTPPLPRCRRRRRSPQKCVPFAQPKAACLVASPCSDRSLEVEFSYHWHRKGAAPCCTQHALCRRQVRSSGHQTCQHVVLRPGLAAD